MCRKTIRRLSKKPKSQRRPSVKVRRAVAHYRQQALVCKPGSSVFLPQRTYTGLESQLITHFPRGNSPGSPKLPGTWAYTAHREASHSARCLFLVAISQLIKELAQSQPDRALNNEPQWHHPDRWNLRTELLHGKWSFPSAVRRLLTRLLKSR